MNSFNTKNIVDDVLVKSSWGNVLRTAIEFKSKGLDILIFGKLLKNYENTFLSANGVNVSFRNLYSQHSWKKDFIDNCLDG